MIEQLKYVPEEETPVDDVRRIRERRSREAGNDVRRQFEQSAAHAMTVWTAIQDAKAAFESSGGKQARVLKLPTHVAWQLAVLPDSTLGTANRGILRRGIHEFEASGLLGMRVELSNDVAGSFSFE